VLLWARSGQSARRATTSVSVAFAKLAEEDLDPDRFKVVTDISELAQATFLVEAVVEHHGMKAEILAELGELSRHAGQNAVLATTTSSLSISELAQASVVAVGPPTTGPTPDFALLVHATDTAKAQAALTKISGVLTQKLGVKLDQLLQEVVVSVEPQAPRGDQPEQIGAALYRRVLVIGGGSLAKLGMKMDGHLKKDMPVLEDVLASMAFLLGPADGRSPVFNLDAVGRHSVGAGSTPQAIYSALVREPLKRLGLRFADVDRYAVELHDPDVTEPAGSGNVPLVNYRAIAALAVMEGQLTPAEMPAFVREHGLPG